MAWSVVPLIIYLCFGPGVHTTRSRWRALQLASGPLNIRRSDATGTCI
jgi:hypothetical protein